MTADEDFRRSARWNFPGHFVMVGIVLLRLWAGITHPMGPPAPASNIYQPASLLTFLLTRFLVSLPETQGLWISFTLNTVLWVGYIFVVAKTFLRFGERYGAWIAFLWFLASPMGWIPSMVNVPRDSLTLFLMSWAFFSLHCSSGKWSKAWTAWTGILLGMQHFEAAMVGFIAWWVTRKDLHKGFFYLSAGILVGKVLQTIFLLLVPVENPFIPFPPSPLYRFVYALAFFPWIMESIQSLHLLWLFSLFGWTWFALVYVLWRFQRKRFLLALIFLIGVSFIVFDYTRVFALTGLWMFLEITKKVLKSRKLFPLLCGRWTWVLPLLANFLPQPYGFTDRIYWISPTSPWKYHLTDRNPVFLDPSQLCPVPPSRLMESFSLIFPTHDIQMRP